MIPFNSPPPIILHEPDRAWLDVHGANVTSQFGEDGLIAAALERIGVAHKSCFEVGAHDGVFFSNTKRLRDNGWRSILIEKDPNLFQELEKHANALTTCLCADFTKIELAGDFDFGVIDIDGQDFYAWKDLACSPRLMLVEFAPNVPDFLPERGAATGQAGLNHILALGAEMGYVALAQTVVNVLFCRREELK